MQYRMQAHDRRAVTRQYLRLPLEWHQRHPTGQLLSNANSDVEAACSLRFGRHVNAQWCSRYSSQRQEFRRDFYVGRTPRTKRSETSGIVADE